IDPDAAVTAVVAGSGDSLDAVCKEAAASYAEVWKIDDQALSYINAEVVRGLLVKILPKGCVFIAANDHFGMDLCPGLSIKLDAAYLPDIVAFEGLEDGKLKTVREEYSGQVSTHVVGNISNGAVISTRPGGFKPDESKALSGQVADKTAEALADGLPGGARRFIEVVEAEVGDVDITKEDVLVSIGRGIEDEDNIEDAEDLAKAMGAVVSCSRPIVDAKWLEKSRQVGTSGQTVKPKVYLALGISGSFQHLGGIKGAPFMVAINKNPKAPIFQVADVGVEGDILDYIPELTEAIEEG
ncbi:MAG: electron transfer flavoprotein subunit alpha/FixB family protein, partial [Desulfobacterales bacterium]|nr:electron transfer flavoprotein subunit alpha/FixB family protein [Desulfobacterales bacterium]